MKDFIISFEGSELRDEGIRKLQIEAGAAGDAKQVELCKRALRGDRRARKACLKVIALAKMRAATEGGES